MSASRARIRGDDYQHLFTWYQAVRAILPESGIVEIGIEDPDAGNADDVTVYANDGRREYYQTKSSVYANKPVSAEWLMSATRSGGPSIIQGFYQLWDEGSDECKPRICLVTNKLPKHGDPLLSHIDGRDSTVMHGLERAKSDSKTEIMRRRLAEHLGVSEDDTVRFFGYVRFTLGRSDGEWRQLVKERMYAAGLRSDDDAVDQGVVMARGWVTGGTRRITVNDLRREVELLKRPEALPMTSILVQAIDYDTMQDGAAVVLDWVDEFPGGEPRSRRQPSDPELWNKRFRPELHRTARELRANGHKHILVKGHMRLPTWFAVGVELGKTAGFQVSSFQGHDAWSSIGELSDISVIHHPTHLGPSKDIAVGISLATDPTKDVLEYIRSQNPGAGIYIRISPDGGASNQAIGDAAEARGWAYSTRDMVRCLTREYRPPRIHLFLAGPHSAILLLGHLWDRLPPTQVYEDLGANNGYAPSYLIPG